jgi:hypothetical protein
MDMRFGTLNVRSVCRPGTLKTVLGEFAEYNLVGVQMLRWE